MQLYLILLVQLFNHTCLRGSKVLITLFAIELGASPIVAGVLFSMYSLLPAFLSVHAGKLTDRIGFRLPMIFGSCGMVAGMLLPFFSPGIPALLGSAVLTGSCYIFYTVSVQNLVGRVGEPGDRTHNYTLYALCVGITALLGPLAAGFGIEHLGGAATYALMAALPLLPIALLSFGLRGVTDRAPGAAEPGPRRIGDLLRNAPLRRMLIIAGIVETVNELGGFLLPVYGSSVGLSPSQIGIVMGVLAAALFLVRALVPLLVRRHGEVAVLGGSLVVAALGCLVMPFTETFVPMMAAAFLLGLGTGCGAPLSMSLVFSRSPHGRSGEAMGLRQSVNKGTEAVVPIVFGGLSTALGMLPVFWGVAAMLGVGSWLMRREGEVPAADGARREH
jgi:MFS family permease